MILVDTSPIVALFDPADHDHKLTHCVLESISEPIYTTEAVITEVFHMLEAGSKGADGVREFILGGYISILSLNNDDIRRCFELMDKYADLPMDFADATLISLAEKYKTDKIFTLDFNDFRVYKIKKGYRYYPLSLLGSDFLN